ncbi:MAG: dihydrodipicolinate synthase family protein [Bryobacteraceae bacterium]
MAAQALGGIVPAVVTPFRRDESIDYGVWQHLIEHLIASGVHGLFAIGGQGEFYALDEEERTVAARFCVQTAAKRVPVYVNAGAVTTKKTVRLAQQAEADGVDYIVVTTPYYIRPSADELVDHLVEVCRSVRIPVLAYNIPERTGVALTPLILQRVAVFAENLIGLKDSSGDLDLIPEWISANLSVFIGRDHMVLPALKLGAVGAVTACANVIPRAFVDLYNAYNEGNIAEAERLQTLISPLREAFGLGTFPCVIKEAMNLVGMPVGHCRRPVSELDESGRERLSAVLDRLRQEGYVPEKAAWAARG